GCRLCGDRAHRRLACARLRWRDPRLAPDLGVGCACRLRCRVVLPARASRSTADDVRVPAVAIPSWHDPRRLVAWALLRRAWPCRNRADPCWLFPVGTLVATVDGHDAKRHAHPRWRVARQERHAVMSGSNEVIHQSMRLKIMAALNALAPRAAEI